MAAALGSLVDEGTLVGFVLGVGHRGRAQLVSGGTRAVDGPPMTDDTVFPLTSNSKPLGGVLALRLVELGVIGLDDPVTRHLPELADLRVLTRFDAPLDDTVPAERPVTLRHLLTMTTGFGWVPEPGPLSTAMAEQHIAPGPYPPPMDSDEFMRRLGSLPLAAQPGQRWLYHTSSDVLGVLLSRATGQPVSELLAEHVTDPLGLTDTGFVAEAERLPTSYGADADGRLIALERPGGSLTTTPRFESLSCGLVSTVGDYLRFLDVLGAGRPVLSRGSAIQMATDHLTPEQRTSAVGMVDPGSGYGFHVEIRPDGSVGWAGGLGTIAYTQPMTGTSAALFTPQSIETPGTEQAFNLFWQLLR